MTTDSIAATALFDGRNSSDMLDEDLGGVFLPDILTPAQYYSAVASNPCQRLLVAILEAAIRCFQRHCGAESPKHSVLLQEAEEWLFDIGGAGFMPYTMVCESLGIEPVQLNRYLRKWLLNAKAGLSAPRLRRLRLVSADAAISSPDMRASRARRIQKRPAVMRI